MAGALHAERYWQRPPRRLGGARPGAHAEPRWTAPARAGRV